MAGKLSFLVGFGAGYVLGARAGRERYEQIAGKAQDLWQDPRVQEKADQAQQLAKDKGGAAASAVADKAAETGAMVADKAKEAMPDKITGSSGAHAAGQPAANDPFATPTNTSPTFGDEGGR